MVNMKKIILFIVATFLLLPFTVNATTNITNLSANYSNRSVKITGDTSDSILAVAVVLYDSTGTNILRMVTDSVSSNTFNTKIDNIDLDVESTYIVKVANYDGGNYYETSFKVVNNAETIENPQTEDTLISSIVIGGLSILGIVGSVLFLNKKKKITSKLD